MNYFTRLTTRESITGLWCLNIQVKKFGGELHLYLEKDFMHLKDLCESIIKKPVVFNRPTQYTEIKINSLFLSKDKIVELDEPWVSLRTKCIRNQPKDVIKLHDTWWKYIIEHNGKYSLAKETMSELDESLKHFSTIKEMVTNTRKKDDYDYILDLYKYIHDNKNEVITELNSRWLISITESLCKLKDDGYQFVLLHTLMRMIQVYHSKLFMIGFYNRIKNDYIEMDDIKGDDSIKYIPDGGWSVLWDGLQVRFENDHVFETMGKNIDDMMTNKICKMIFKEFINRIPSMIMKENSKSWILND